MKKLLKKNIFILIFLLQFPFLIGCQDNKKIEVDLNNQLEEKTEEGEEKEEYVDLNPIKIALYQKKNGVYKRQDVFYSKMEHFKDIGLFSIILSEEEERKGSIKGLYQEYSKNYENFLNYKIGYHIKFSLKDGTEFDETILKPLEFSKFSFSNYLYIWFYDDVNNSGWYSHLEEKDFKENTVLSSIKLMSTKGSDEISTPIYLTVFTYDSDDFDASLNYRGVSKFTTIIEREG